MLKKAPVLRQTPKEISNEMDKYIIGQDDAKKAVAIAFVNRWRRMMIDDEKLRDEISPKNVLLSGPTGVGKTEIARRVADITDSPFLKVEMTKFTEVGYAGRDVETIIRDLVDLTVKRERDKMIKERESAAKKMALKYVFQAMKDAKGHSKKNLSLQTIKPNDGEFVNENYASFVLSKESTNDKNTADLEISEAKLANGEYDNMEILIALPEGVGSKKDPFSDFGDGFPGNIGGGTAMISIIPLFSFKSGKDGDKVIKNLKVREALEMMADYYINEYVDKNIVVADILKKIEQKGVVFLDEIDKLISNKESQSRGEVSREGVQRDLLPIVEGTMVQTKYGPVRTDHILFIAAGAFHDNKVGDLMPELQGRFPVCVELKSLKVKDFERILTDLKYNLPNQQQKLLKVSGIDIKFEKSAIRSIAEIAYRMNSELENVGARRLFSVIEKVVEEISFSGKKGTKLTIDGKYVKKATESGFDKKIDTKKYMI